MHDDRIYDKTARVEMSAVTTDDAGEQKRTFVVAYESMPCAVDAISPASKLASPGESGLRMQREMMVRFPSGYFVRPGGAAESPDAMVIDGKRYAVKGVWNHEHYSRAVIEETR